MVLPHEFPFNLSLGQPEQGLDQSCITDQLRALAWKSKVNYSQFRQVSHVVAKEEEEGRQIETVIKENLERQRISTLRKQVLKEILQFSSQSTNMVRDGSAHQSS